MASLQRSYYRRPVRLHWKSKPLWVVHTHVVWWMSHCNYTIDSLDLSCELMCLWFRKEAWEAWTSKPKGWLVLENRCHFRTVCRLTTAEGTRICNCFKWPQSKVGLKKKKNTKKTAIQKSKEELESVKWGYVHFHCTVLFLGGLHSVVHNKVWEE